MNRYTKIVVSCLIFLFGLSLFKAVFLALGITLVFLFLVTLFEVVWQYRESIVILGLASLMMTVVMALTFYILIYLPIEFLTTEILLIVPKVPSLFSLTFLLLLVIGFSLVNWDKILKIRLFAWVLVGLVVLSGFCYGIYRSHKLVREYLPKIYRISPNSGIQAEIVEIKGVNFFPVWKMGRIVLGGDNEMVIKFWDEELIRVEMPVPGRFGQVELWVVRSDGVISNKVFFEIKDPGKLKN